MKTKKLVEIKETIWSLRTGTSSISYRRLHSSCNKVLLWIKEKQNKRISFRIRCSGRLHTISLSNKGYFSFPNHTKEEFLLNKYSENDLFKNCACFALFNKIKSSDSYVRFPQYYPKLLKQSCDVAVAVKRLRDQRNKEETYYNIGAMPQDYAKIISCLPEDTIKIIQNNLQKFNDIFNKNITLMNRSNYFNFISYINSLSITPYYTRIKSFYASSLPPSQTLGEINLALRQKKYTTLIILSPSDFLHILVYKKHFYNYNPIIKIFNSKTLWVVETPMNFDTVQIKEINNYDTNLIKSYEEVKNSIQ